MFSLKLAFAIAVAVTAARAGPTVNDDNCQNFIGDCFQNGECV